jgi:tetratricopeptide (TPR) repeat protein
MTLSEPVLITPILEKLYLVNNIGEIGRLSQKLVESNPQDYYAWETLATYYQIISDKEKLMSALKRMILLDPVNVDAILKAAKLSKELGLRPEVKALALRVLSIAPESPQADEANLLLDEVVE